MADNLPPPDDVQLAFDHWMAMNHSRLPAPVQRWLDSRKPAAPVRGESAAERFKRLPRPDTPARAEPWTDPRPQRPDRWHNPRAR
jgi:hypothetical protein